MSKNGSRLFKNFNPYITSAFGYRIHPITGVRKLHEGVDYGTNNQKLPTYGISKGEVVGTGYQKAIGNYVYVNYPKLEHNAIYEHLDSISVKKGQSIDTNTIIGYVGATGDVTGIHLHFGWFPSKDQNKDWYSRDWQDFEEYNFPLEIKYLGTPVAKNTKKDQIEVVIKNLHIRNNANGVILGYVKEGIYDILDKKVLTDYTWYKIGEGMWIAYIKTYTNIYLKEEKPDDKPNNDTPTKEPEQEKEPELEDSKPLENPDNEEENQDETETSTNWFSKLIQKIIEFIKNFFK